MEKYCKILFRLILFNLIAAIAAAFLIFYLYNLQAHKRISAANGIEHFRIPLIIYAPKIFKPEVIKTLGSHNDLFPTIVDMMGWKADITTMGNSLIDKDIKKRFVYFFGSRRAVRDGYKKCS